MTPKRIRNLKVNRLVDDRKYYVPGVVEVYASATWTAKSRMVTAILTCAEARLLAEQLLAVARMADPS